MTVDQQCLSRVTAVVPAVAYMVSSASLSVLNRYLMKTRLPAFPFATLLIAIQGAIILVFTALGIRHYWASQLQDSPYWPTRVSRGTAWRLAVVGFLWSADIMLTQSALRFAPVPLVEITKSLVSVVVLMEVAGLHCRRPALREVIVILAISFGVQLATGHDGVAYNVEPGGLSLAVGATIVAGTRLVAAQMLLQGTTCPTPLLLMYMAPAQLLTGMTCFFVFDAWRVNDILLPLEPPHLVGTIGLLALSSFLAFALNFTELWNIGATSALVLTLLGALKTILLVIFSAILAGHYLSSKALLGCGLATFGSLAFKLFQKAAPPAETQSQPNLQLRLATADGVDEANGADGCA